MTPETREWSKGYFAKVGMMPTMLQTGVYGAVLHYLKAVKAANSTDPGTVMAKMQEIPVSDGFVKGAHLRADGQVIRDMYLAGSKTPQQSKYPLGLPGDRQDDPRRSGVPAGAKVSLSLAEEELISGGQILLAGSPRRCSVKA